jgi:hypothetical protein
MPAGFGPSGPRPIGVAGAWSYAQIQRALQFLRSNSTFGNACTDKPADSPRGRDERARSSAPRADGAACGEARSKPGWLPESIRETRGKLTGRAAQRQAIMLHTFCRDANIALAVADS